MRTGYILLHRQGLTQEEWKHPLRTLAWFDFLTLANYEDAIVTASYGFLATRWRKSKGEVHRIIKLWISQGMIEKRERSRERSRERERERNGERFFVVNYAEYQRREEPSRERVEERTKERSREPMYKVSSIKSIEVSQENVRENAQTPSEQTKLFFEDVSVQQKVVEYFTSKGFGDSEVRAELAKFISYWTEPTHNGKKQLWQTKKTFDVKRRIVTWMGRVSGIGKPSSVMSI